MALSTALSALSWVNSPVANATEREPWLRRFPSAAPLSCEALLLRPAGPPEKLFVFADSEIERVHSVQWVPGSEYYVTSHSTLKLVLLQHSTAEGAAAAAVARMLVSGAYTDFSALPSLATLPAEDVRLGLEQLGVASKQLPWTVTEIIPMVSLDNLADLIDANGPGAITLELNSREGVRRHTVLVDSVHPENETVEIRDPFHGWAITVHGRALLKRVQRGGSVPVTFLRDHFKRSLLQQWKHENLRRKKHRTHTAELIGRIENSVKLEKKTEAAERLLRQSESLLEADFRSVAISETIVALNAITEQIPLYAPDSEERAKLELASLCFRLRILKLSRETLQLEQIHLAALEASIEPVVAEIQNKLFHSALDPDERSVLKYAELARQLHDARKEESLLPQKKQSLLIQRQTLNTQIAALEQEVRTFLAHHPSGALQRMIQRMQPFENRFGQLALHVLEPAGEKKIQDAVRNYQDRADGTTDIPATLGALAKKIEQ